MCIDTSREYMYLNYKMYEYTYVSFDKLFYLFPNIYKCTLLVYFGKLYRVMKKHLDI